MAAIDKMYTTSYKNYMEFKEWCKHVLLEDKYGKREPISSYLIHWEENDFNDNKERPIFSAPCYVDAYVIRNCPLQFMQDEMKLHYGGYNPNFGEYANSYNKIKAGELYAKPSTDLTYEVGRHFKCVKHPFDRYRDTPFLSKTWFVDVEIPDGMGFMWYHKDTDTWDFCDEYVISEWTSSNAFAKSIKSLKRRIIKWKLPIGTKIRVTGRYIGDEYEFIVTK